VSESAGFDARGGGIRNWASVFLKGVAMGAADAIPGVSGGTIALITGIYDRLIEAIAGLTEHGPDLVSDLREGGNPDRFATASATLRTMDLPFLVVLGLGVLTGVGTLANLIDLALEAYRALTFAFFFGVILVSPVVLRGEVELRRPRPLAAGVAGFLLAFAVAGLPYRQAEYSLPALFLIGAIGISAMVLPGISGSLVLLIIGAYEGLTGAVSDLTRALVGMADGGGVGPAVEPLTVLAVFAAGAFVGVLTFARVVSRALEVDRVATMTFLVGVMFGALRTPVREIAGSVRAFTAPVVLSLVAAGVVGAFVVLVLEYVTGGID
jgi:putative membrane protein